jgi:hypothetical protein
MNHRLDELYEQSLLSIPYRICPNSYKEIDDPAGDRIRKVFDPETFAELIVKECHSVIVKSHRGHMNPDLSWNAVKEHFGVEE